MPGSSPEATGLRPATCSMTDPVSIGLLTLLGAWAALDGTSVGQFMISRPIVAGALAGWVLADPATGFLVGALIEGLYLGELPAGGVRLPEPGPAAVPAALVAIQHPGPGGLALGVGVGVAWSLIGGVAVFGQRRLNGRVIRRARSGRSPAVRLGRAHWICVAVDAVRGGALTVLGIAAALLIPAGWAARWSLGWVPTLVLLGLPGLLAGGTLLRSWVSARGRGVLLALGWCGGLVLALLL